MTSSLMFQGTGSDVGKTILVAGLCRALTKRGMKVRPFKPQNMSNNAAVAEAGGQAGEIGRAQWLQAMACRIPASIHMNPVLLKPQSDQGSQVIVHGKVHSTARARDYQALKPTLLKAVLDSFEELKREADIVLVEGAGSPAEINLRAGDIANMGFAQRAEVPVVLVGDIDRGGVIASIVGTRTILPVDDCAMIKGFLINKFRGDISLFDDGLDAITRFTNWQSFGVLPFLDIVRKLPAEDSVALERPGSTGGAGQIRVAVPALPRIANFDDLDPLFAEPDVSVRFVNKGQPWPDPVDLVVLPGSKATISDMSFLQEQGWDRKIADHARRGGKVIGICGGYQMLGKVIRDPNGIEGSQREIAGLGLLDIETELENEKVVKNSSARSIPDDLELAGYEIHLGRTYGPDCERPMIMLNERPDGATSPDGGVSGCYLHGLFGSDEYRKSVLVALGAGSVSISYRQEIEGALDELGEAMERHLNVDEMLQIAKIGAQSRSKA
ncbi:MAG: cobyric acid synthase [Rhizobiaceae bacterium]